MKLKMVNTNEVLSLFDNVLEQIDVVEDTLSSQVNQAFTTCEEAYSNHVQRIDQSLREIEAAAYEIPPQSEWRRREVLLRTV
ncbi:hypothetical protein LZP85_05690 [Priestia flexa]|uniref:Uncharacterized protein n=1 Tax=Priestia flexa TaxID=86664 RepID=A0A8I1SPI3_9BACI|nr:hypothetical protein [Priestia flexa]MBN8252411.1 hypothetical protein [Priestia flexa]MBN8433881.1 hypothetical protein [Priestia flexa]MCA0966411.1 hypothetical protein [Priestia flexa]RIV12179.1 hypothetical protein D1859_06385 [Priestia flexa]UIR31281.1 hypothetical protein LZP85_05690 [Priestia flexa]